VLEALEQHPRWLGTPLVFPGHDGGYLKQGTWRARQWDPALRAAGIEHRDTYACRHRFAAWAIAAGVQLFYLSRIMGTSVTQIDPTSGILCPTRRITSEGYSTNTTTTR
jgi:integrase